MSLYPTLEDLKMSDVFSQREEEELRRQLTLSSNGSQPSQINESDFMGVKVRHYYDDKGNVVFSEPIGQDRDAFNPSPSIEAPKNVNLPHMEDRNKQVAIDHSSLHTTPRSNVYPELSVYDVKQGVRKLVMDKNEKGVFGFQIRSINDGIFVSFVQADSSAAKAGMRFGDQVLEIDDIHVSGKSEHQVGKVIKNAPKKNAIFIVRDRPYEKTIALNKDTNGKTGFTVCNGTIIEVIQGSSAAKNGVLTNSQLIELNGINVIGLEDKIVTRMIGTIPDKVVITTIPKNLYNILIKKLGQSQLRKEMDRSQPQL